MASLMLYHLFVHMSDRKVVVFKKHNTLEEHVTNRLNGQPFIFATYRNAHEFVSLAYQYYIADSSTVILTLGKAEEQLQAANAFRARHPQGSVNAFACFHSDT
jgi:hypothetical protein